MPPTDDFHTRAREHLLESAQTTRRTVEQCLGPVVEAADLITESFRSGGKVLLCGNGGSAADCQHMATEFVSRLTKDFERPGLPAIALTTDTSFLTAYSNDYDFGRRIPTPGTGPGQARRRSDRYKHQRQLNQRDSGGNCRPAFGHAVHRTDGQ